MNDSEQTQKTELSPRWRRFLAFVIDYFVVVLLCWFIALSVEDTIIAMGDWARIIGFGILVIYYALLDSALLGKASPGKRLLGIRVVTASGHPPSVSRAGVRAGVLAIPFTLNGMFLSDPNMDHLMLWGVLLFAGVFGLGLALLYLFLFNRTTRQSLHDWLTGTFTVSATSDLNVSRLPPLWRPHLAIAGALLLLAAILPMLGMQYAQTLHPEWASLESLQDAQATLTEHPDVLSASVSQWQQDGGRRYYSVNVRTRKHPDQMHAFASSLAEQMRERVPRMAGEPIVVHLSRGWSMGVWSVMETQSYPFR
jgi:uncharacterized RDD family membrane protein YckC